MCHALDYFLSFLIRVAFQTSDCRFFVLYITLSLSVKTFFILIFPTHASIRPIKKTFLQHNTEGCILGFKNKYKINQQKGKETRRDKFEKCVSYVINMICVGCKAGRDRKKK